MPNLLQTILEGSPSEIHGAIREALEETVEDNLQEAKKVITAKMFSGDLKVEETVARKPWTKQSIRETLEEAMLNKGRVENFNEASGSGWPGMPVPSSHPLHKMVVQHGFKHKSKGQNSHGYSNEKGHYVVLHHSGQNKKGFTLIPGGGPTKHVTGKSTEEMASAFVKHGI